MTLLSEEALALANIAQHDTPVTCIAMHPEGTFAAVASSGGHLAVHHITFATLHSLHQDLYAHRQCSAPIVCPLLRHNRWLRMDLFCCAQASHD